MKILNLFHICLNMNLLNNRLVDLLELFRQKPLKELPNLIEIQNLYHGINI